jgi:hypothetical protein
MPSSSRVAAPRVVEGNSPTAILSRSRSLFAAAAILLVPAVASATLTYGAAVTTVPTVQNSPTPVVLSGFENQPDGRHGEGSARAASILAGRAVAACPARGLNNGLFEAFSFNANGNYDDIVIDGPVAGASVPFVLHLPVNANFLQDWSSITFSAFTEASQPNNSADFLATIFTPTGAVEGRLVLTLIDQNDTAQIQPTGQVIPTGNPGPGSIETGPGGITIFHNVPLGSGGFLNLLTRTQIPLTSSGGPFGPGAGFSANDIVELRAEILLTGTATVGTPLILNLVMSGGSTATGTSDQPASATIDATGTFGVPQDGSVVFDLPTGFTASSTSLRIVDNVVPEPSGPAAGGMVLAALATLTSRRHRPLRGNERLVADPSGLALRRRSRLAHGDSAYPYVQ